VRTWRLDAEFKKKRNALSDESVGPEMLSLEGLRRHSTKPGSGHQQPPAAKALLKGMPMLFAELDESASVSTTCLFKRLPSLMGGLPL
jgi:hypothetical protein